ncbi:hypothetical protein [Streptomyces himastatinicus]|uniref:hypothetical protein n=1 Tax=Streptomyces himastatinicus TaxID=998084 RepID=UPI0001B4F3DD|nr:hypothetical protein [Streptomyces himastatinicus]
MSEMLSYLAVALPADASPEARVLALQCALRMNASMRVQLPAGLLRSLGIDAAQVSRELERAGWLSVMDSPRAAGIAAQLLDATLLAQAPARPDRRRAADWALRNGCPARAGAADPGLQLLGVYLTVHGDPSSGNGSRECDWIKRDCGMPDQALPGALDQLKGSGVLKGWRICPDSGDMHWILASEQE